LIAPLRGAVALAEMHYVAVFVRKQLDFNVARVLNQLLNIHAVVPEERLGFGLCRLNLVFDFLFFVHGAYSSAAAARRRLD
jgi:hypothetical protein